MNIANKLLERVAFIQHEIWSHWMKYLFSCCTFNENGDAIIPSEKAQRWQRQIETSYDQLSEKEKNSDRDQADKVLIALAELSKGGTDGNI